MVVPPRGAPSERPSEAWLAVVAAALLVAQQVASKATRDALFLTSFDPRRLPIVMAAGALLSLMAVLAMGRALAQHGPARVVPAALVVNATFYAIEWIAAPLFRDAIAVALYLHVAALGSVMLSGFWTLVSERHDPHRARGFVSRVAAGATFGGVLGGVSVDVIAGAFGARTMLIVLSLTSLAIAAAIVAIAARDVERRALASEAPEPSLALVVRTPYLRSLALMSLLAAVWESLIDFAFKAQADRVYEDEASLVTFFAIFYTVTNLVTFFVQTLLGSTMLRRLGLVGTVSLLPVAVSASSVAILFASPFALLVALRGGESVLSNSLFRAGYELFFTPLARETKRPTKTIVDVASTRVGDAIGSLLVLVLVQSWVDMPLVAPVAVASGAALLSLLLLPRLARGYVEALQRALRDGTVDLEEHATLDATTRRTVSTAPLVATVAEVAAEVADAPQPPPDAGIVSRFAALASGATDPARAALRHAIERELVPIALPWLAHPHVGREALEALQRAAPRATGALIDALTDPRTPFEVRFRIPRVLRACPTERAAAGLAAGLDDPRLEVRLQCARALVHLASESDTLAPTHTLVLCAVERELEDRGATWSAIATPHDAHAHTEDEPLSLDELVRMRASRSLQYVLTLLSLVIDGEGLQLALRGLSAGDDGIRGTAVELLQNILPEPVRSSLMPVLAGRTRAEMRARSREELVAELLRSQQTLPLVRTRA